MPYKLYLKTDKNTKDGICAEYDGDGNKITEHYLSKEEYKSTVGNDGAEGLGIFRSSSSATTATTSISISTITVPSGRSIKIGDLIIANSTYSYLYRVTAVNASTVTVTWLQTLRGATGAKGATGDTGPAGADGAQGEQGPQGEQGEAGVGIESIEQTVSSTVSGGRNELTITLTDGRVFPFEVYNGAVGNAANQYVTVVGGIAIGLNAQSTSGIAMGNAAQAAPHSIAIGLNAKSLCNGSQTNGVSSIAIGNFSYAGNFSIAIGEHVSTGEYIHSVSIGYGANASASYQFTLGGSTITALRCNKTTISTLSDSRVKEDISDADVDICLADVNRLPVKRYKYKAFTGTHLDEHRTGFMADDVEKVFPKDVMSADEYFPVLDENGEAVMELDLDENGNPQYDVVGIDEGGKEIYSTEPRMKKKMFLLEQVKTISMEMAIPTLWGAVQALTKRLQALEEKES